MTDRHFTTVDLASLPTAPEGDWLHAEPTPPEPGVTERLGFLPRVGVSGLVGAPRCFKTIAAVQAAVSVTTGSLLFGTMAPIVEGEAAIFELEGSLAFPFRVAEEECRARGVSYERCLERLHVIAEQNVKFDTRSDLDALRAFCPRHPGLRLVVIDNLSRACSFNVNLPERMTAFVGSLEQVAREFEVAILLLHHTRRLRRRIDLAFLVEQARGSNAFDAALEQSLTFWRPDRRLDRIVVQTNPRGTVSQTFGLEYVHDALDGATLNYLGPIDEDTVDDWRALARRRGPGAGAENIEELAAEILTILRVQVGPGIGLPIKNLRERLREASGSGRKTDHLVAARKLLLDEGAIVLDARGRVMLPEPTGMQATVDPLEQAIRRHSGGADMIAFDGGRS